MSFDTYITPAGAEAARLERIGCSACHAGCARRCGVDNAFGLMRPPGHHALSTRAMGYCIYNNIAIAALYALRERGLEQVMILDVDAHHGNGTEEIFYGSRNVLFLSLPPAPLVPRDGRLAP